MTQKPEPTEVEIFLAMDEEGNPVVSLDRDDLQERIADMAGENATLAVRVVTLKVKMTPPAIMETHVDVPDEVGAVSASVAA